MSKPVILLDAGELVALPGANDGDVLTWNGTLGQWQSSPGGGTGTVTSVALSTGSTGLTVSGGTSQTITGAGTFALGGTLGAGFGGTGLGAPASGDAGKVLTATSGGGYVLSTPAPAGVTSITAGAGLLGGVITSTGTISMPNVGTPNTYGNVAQVPFITTDAQGRVSGVTLSDIQIAQVQVTGLGTALSGKVSTATQVLAGAGLTGGGALSGDVTLSLGTVGTAQTGLGSASKTVTVTTDVYGRVTSLSEQDIAIAGSAITSGAVALANGGTGQNLSGIAAGEVIVGQAGGGSVGAVAVSGDATLAASGLMTVIGLQGRSVSSSAPISGQSLVWSSAGGGAWVPGDTASGGSGGGGVVYFMNAGTSRTGGGLPAGSYQLGRTAEVAPNPITVTNVPVNAWTRIAGFVTDTSDPNLGTLPAGIWDFNVYATSTANSNDMLFRLSFYEYNGSTDPELGSPIATTLSTAIYDPSVAVQYQATFNIPQTPFASKRMYLKLEAFTSVASKDVTFDFGNNFASHVHTTVPSVTGSGFVKVLNDVIVSTGQTINLADSTDVGSSILGVSNGGTGASSLTQHAVLVGNGTSAVTSYALANGQVLVGQTGGAPAAATLTGGTGVGITNGSNSITISIGQAVGTGDSPTFANVTASGLTASQYVRTNSSKQLISSATVAAADLDGIVAIANGGTGAATTSQRFAFIGPISGSGAPSFRALVAADISDLSSAGVTSITGTANQVIASSSTGAVTLSLPQNIGTSNSPTFAGLTLSGLTGYIKGNGGSALSASSTVPTSDLSGTISLTAQVSGTLPVGNGGTGLSSIATGQILYASGTNTLAAGTLSDLNWSSVSPSSSISIVPASVSSLGRPVVITGGTSTSGNGGATTVQGGASTGGNGNGGSLTIRGGAKNGTGSDGAVNIGQTNTSAVNIGATGITTAIAGTATATTASAGDNSTNVATTAFVATAVAAASSTPYDLPFEIPGTPEAAVKRVVNFEAVRAFVLATTGHQGGQVTAPSGNYVCTVKKNATTLGTITFASGGFSSNITATLADRTFAAGDVLIVETPSANLGIDTPFATFFMTLV